MKRLTFIWAEDLTEEQTEELSRRIDRAMENPDEPIVTNFPIEFNQVEIPEDGDAQEAPHHCCGGGVQNGAGMKRVVAIIAPETRTEDLPALEKQIEEAIAGHKHYLVTNQPIEICRFDVTIREDKPE